MSDTLFKLFGGAILSVMLLVILRKGNPDTALTARMVIGVILAAACVGALLPITEYIRELGDAFSAAYELSEAVSVLLKALGVAVLTQICSAACRDAGEGSIAYYVELGGKVEIMLMSVPLLREMLETVTTLLEMS